MKKTHTVRKALTREQLYRSGTTLVGLAVAQSLDEIIAEVRGSGGGMLDPMTISISTQRIGILNSEGLGIEVSIDTRNVLEATQ